MQDDHDLHRNKTYSVSGTHLYDIILESHNTGCVIHFEE